VYYHISSLSATLLNPFQSQFLARDPLCRSLLERRQSYSYYTFSEAASTHLSSKHDPFRTIAAILHAQVLVHSIVESQRQPHTLRTGQLRQKSPVKRYRSSSISKYTLHKRDRAWTAAIHTVLFTIQQGLGEHHGGIYHSTTALRGGKYMQSPFQLQGSVVFPSPNLSSRDY
jgi:hypothetical protein